ncbi:MAG: high-potential iron-sulfur protein [Bdellovibrionales bacterium]|nr:high-potential iron-sulfur protein [Bdellovibrionales bacterium]
MSKDTRTSRRNFLKILAQTTVAVPVGCVASRALCQELAAEDKKPIDPNDAKAKQFGYYEDATKVDTTKWPKRTGADADKQFCSSCQLLLSQSGEYGNCSLFPEGVVATKGWCNMWVAKVG